MILFDPPTMAIIIETIGISFLGNQFCGEKWRFHLAHIKSNLPISAFFAAVYCNNYRRDGNDSTYNHGIKCQNLRCTPKGDIAISNFIKLINDYGYNENQYNKH